MTKSKRLQVSVVRSTKKAVLVRTIDGRESWMQNRWVKNEGEQLTVNQETFNRNFLELANKTKVKEEERAFKDGFHDLPLIERETEKAVAVNATLTREATDEVISRMVWFPKSQLKNGQAPGWLINAKLKRLLSGIPHSWSVEAQIGDFRL